MNLYLIRHGQSANNHLYATTGSDMGRDSDPELTALGCAQADELARYLASGPLVMRATTPFGILDGFEDVELVATSANGESPAFAPVQSQPAASGGAGPLTHIYTSPMQRAVHTALPSGRALGLPVVAWRELHEGGGLFLEDPVTHEYIGQRGPDRLEAARLFPGLIWPDEMGDGPWWDRPFEEATERLPRARRVMAGLLERHPAAGSDRVAFFTHAAFTNYFLSAVLGFEERSPVWFSVYNCAITRIRFRADGAPVIIFTDHIAYMPPELISG